MNVFKNFSFTFFNLIINLISVTGCNQYLYDFLLKRDVKSSCNYKLVCWKCKEKFRAKI